VIAGREEEEEDIIYFSRKSSLFDHLHVQNGLTDFYFFWFKLFVAMPPFRICYDAIQNFLYFSSSVPENGLW